jgi:hypothetical protein
MSSRTRKLRSRACGGLKQHIQLQKKESPKSTHESGLYAFTADREGRMLPSQMYPQIAWRFEQTLTLRLDENSLRDQILRAALDGIAKRGFHLIHAAIYGELPGFTIQDIGTDHCLYNLSPGINNKDRQ